MIQRSRRDPQSELRVRLRELAGSRVRYGYRRLTVLRREGRRVSAKRVYRLYREEDLQVRTAKRTAKPSSHTRVPLAQPGRANQRWRMDFVIDRFSDGSWFRILTVVDRDTRECLCAYAGRSQTGEKVVQEMKHLVKLRGAPESERTVS